MAVVEAAGVVRTAGKVVAMGRTAAADNTAVVAVVEEAVVVDSTSSGLAEAVDTQQAAAGHTSRTPAAVVLAPRKVGVTSNTTERQMEGAVVEVAMTPVEPEPKHQVRTGMITPVC